MSEHVLNGQRDLAMDCEMRPYIGKRVEFLRYTKSGMAYVQTHDGKMLSVPRSNLDPRPPAKVRDAHLNGEAQ